MQIVFIQYNQYLVLPYVSNNNLNKSNLVQKKLTVRKLSDWLNSLTNICTKSLQLRYPVLSQYSDLPLVPLAPICH